MPPTAETLLALQAESLRGPVACVDLETTGGLAAQHRVIEVGIVLLEGGRIVEEWSSLVQPGSASRRRSPPSPASTTPWSRTRRRLPRSRRGAAAAAGPAVRRAQRALRLWLPADRVPPPGQQVRGPGAVHGQAVARALSAAPAPQPRHADGALPLDCSARHRALGDAQVLPALLAAMEQELGAPAVDEAAVAALREPRLPAQLPPELADDLPESPGVYLFRGEAGPLLYVGKSRNIRSRVFDHFASRTSLGQGIEADPPGAPGGVDRDRRRTGRAVARVAAGEGVGRPPATGGCARTLATASCGWRRVATACSPK